MTSSFVLAALCITALVCFVCFYANTLYQEAKASRQRRRIDLSQKLRVLGDLAQSLPGQYMSPGLMSLLHRLEIEYLEKLSALGDRTAALPSKIVQLEEACADPSQSMKDCKPRPVISDAVAKDLRNKIQMLNAIIISAAQDSLIDTDIAVRWNGLLKTMVTSVYTEMFTRCAAAAMSARLPKKAIHILEQAIQYLARHPGSVVYAGEISQFKSALADAHALDEEIVAAEADNSTNLLMQSVDRIFDEEQSLLKRTF